MNKPGPKLIIIAAEFNKPLIDAMIEVATAEMTAKGAQLAGVLRVPGCYEIPLITDISLGRGDVDAAVLLGYIERGETLHGEVMAHVTGNALMDIQLKHRKPIGIGIIGPGATAAQAEVRKEGHARSAVRAALSSLATLGRV